MKRRIGLLIVAALVLVAMLVPMGHSVAYEHEDDEEEYVEPGPGDTCPPSHPYLYPDPDDPSRLVCGAVPLPLVTVCVLEPATEFALDVGTQEVDPITAQILIASGLATLGPCPEGDGGDGGDGGGQQGGGGGGAAAPLEITQEGEQEAESGDIDQSFEVTSTGDNSNQCAGVQGVSNTGNPQNVIDLLQATSDADDFEFDEVGSDVMVSPESPTTCDQQVNQAASASG